jgi:2-hydroxy-3-keto-5-methylthiopentenyl-1-phosphate phosphatase
MKNVLFLDFDGTITRHDVTDLILEAFAEPQWRAIEADWEAGRMGSRDCLHAQMRLVRASRRELDDLLDSIEIDDGFGGLLEVCACNSIQVHIVSEGFDYCIRRILARSAELTPLLRGVRICASHLEPEGDRWRIEFPFAHHSCPHGCATCKPMVMRLLTRASARAIFVGDGLSDRYAAQHANEVFAKSRLADFCATRGIAFFPYARLAEVAAHLAARGDALNGRADEEILVGTEAS